MSVAVPEEFAVGDVVYYSGEPVKKSDGSTLAFGAAGQMSARGQDIQRVEVLFEDCSVAQTVLVTWLSREDPVLANGLKVGDRVYWQGGKHRFPSGNCLMFGLQGGITGCGSTEKKIKVLFDGNESATEASLVQICVKAPVIPGGYEVSDEVHYCGEKETFTNGDTLENGLKGEVVGRSTTGDASDEKRAKIMFEGHSTGIAVLLSQVCREYPEIPAGCEIGDTVFYAGNCSQKLGKGDKLEVGMKGRITGRGTLMDGKDSMRVKVRFEGNKGPVNVFATEVSKEEAVTSVGEDDSTSAGA